MEVATPSKDCFHLIYIFFEVMLMSGVGEIRSCLKNYIGPPASAGIGSLVFSEA